ncbi:hypothetical protein B0H13DRAFT_2369081 [Mycena leptocephala]|nr:hypothetical protein B0H13DRAFT_2369081 [Mycena leptocephala]
MAGGWASGRGRFGLTTTKSSEWTAGVRRNSEWIEAANKIESESAAPAGAGAGEPPFPPTPALVPVFADACAGWGNDTPALIQYAPYAPAALEFPRLNDAGISATCPCPCFACCVPSEKNTGTGAGAGAGKPTACAAAATAPCDAEVAPYIDPATLDCDPADPYAPLYPYPEPDAYAFALVLFLYLGAALSLGYPSAESVAAASAR